MKKIRTEPIKRGSTIYEKIYEIIVYTQAEIDRLVECAKTLGYEYAYAIHDADKKEDGTFKKWHCHFQTFHEREKSINAYAKEMSVPINMVEWKASKELSIQYLIHKNNKDKTQYDSSIICANFDVMPYLEKETKHNEEEEVKAIMKFMQDYPNCTTYEIVMFATDNGMYGTFRRSFQIIKQIKEEARRYENYWYRTL